MKVLLADVSNKTINFIYLRKQLLLSYYSLQETVKREALNGVFDIDTTKVFTPAVLVGLNLLCACVCVCVCVCMHACVRVCGYPPKWLQQSFEF